MNLDLEVFQFSNNFDTIPSTVFGVFNGKSSLDQHVIN